MEISLEREIKVVLDERLDEWLRGVDLDPFETTTIVDVYYDTPDRRLFIAGVFLRIRNNVLMQVKFTPDPNDQTHTWSTETSFQYPLPSEAVESAQRALRTWIPGSASPDFLEGFGLSEFVTVAKSRRSSELGSLTIAVDHVEGLGDFVEIEAHGPTGMPELQGLQRRLQLTNVPVGYVELMLRKTQPALYRRGRYLLPEDEWARLPGQKEVSFDR